MKELQYPFDGEYIIRKKKQIKRRLLESVNNEKQQLTKVKIAVLGGSTTSDVVACLELFLLDNGFEPQFYESDYNRYWEEAMFDNEKLSAFAPNIIYIYTTNRNIMSWPFMTDSNEQIQDKLEREFKRFQDMWESLEKRYQCIVIQNNMEFVDYRLLGNGDAVDCHGKINYLQRLNAKFYEYARAHERFYINDIQYLSACYGLDKWADRFYWFMYKYAMDIKAIPLLADSVSKIIKSIYGKNKKVLVIDLDNTLWGGMVGENGADGLEMQVDTVKGQAYREFQEYIKEQRDIGVLLCVCSKNNEQDALEGLNSKQCILKPDDFSAIKANWENKSININVLSKELTLLPESFVFVDDNAVEREEVRQRISGIAIPEISSIENFIREIDRNSYFEMTSLTGDDLQRADMYKANARRVKESKKFENYEDFLLSLKMKAEIKEISTEQVARTVQLMNKSNQFNLTTLRMTEGEMAIIMMREEYIAMYGSLTDCYGENGIVSVVLGYIEDRICHIKAFLLSCRVIKRDMEKAMLDRLVSECCHKGISELRGYYYPTEKNKLVKDFYSDMGFEKIDEDTYGNTTWKLDILRNYSNKNKVIQVEEIG